MSNKQGDPPCDHSLEDGDTFSKLALAYYGSDAPEKVKRIGDANPDIDATKLKIGQVIRIPVDSDEQSQSRKQGDPPCDHTIEVGDTFSKLALAYYGSDDPEKARKIADANPDIDATKLKIGHVIRIPA